MLCQILFIFPIIVILQPISTVTVPHMLAQQNLIFDLIIKHFDTCDIIWYEDTRNGESVSNWKASMVNFIPKNYIRSLFSLETPNETTNYAFSIRKYTQCLLTLAKMNKGTIHLGDFERLLFANFDAPAKSDEDYFIFITSEKYIHPILQSSTVKKLKYRVAIPAISQMDVLNGFSMCFYCPLEKTSQLVTIDLENATLRENIFPDFTLNGNGYSMRTSSPTKYKFTTEIEEINGKWRLIRGISKSIMDGVLPHYNFTYNVFASPNGDTGSPNKNGTWNGCIGQLMSGEADLALTTSANHARFLVIGFSTAAFYAWVSFTVGQPRQHYSWKAIFWSFSKELWLAIISSLLAVIIIFKLFEKYELQYAPYYQRRNVSPQKNLVTEVTFILIGRNAQWKSESTHSRVLLCTWILCSLVINSLYNSKIVGLLAQPIYENPPRTFEDLAESKYSVGMDIAGGSLYAYFQTSSSPIFQKMFRKFERPKETVNCFAETTHRDFACVTWGGVSVHTYFIFFYNMHTV